MNKTNGGNKGLGEIWWGIQREEEERRFTKRDRDLQGEEEKRRAYRGGENYKEKRSSLADWGRITRRARDLQGEEEIYKERRARMRMRMRMKKREQPCRLGEIYKESRIFQREGREEVVDKKSPIFTKRKGAALQAGGGLQREEEGLTGWERITKRREEEFIKRERVL